MNELEALKMQDRLSASAKLSDMHGQSVYKDCSKHGGLTFDRVKLEKNGFTSRGNQRYILRCRLCLHDGNVKRRKTMTVFSI